eukprot:scaffold10143_cov119-Skeletonema_dohrnii-CCMP3373.AAC.2
MNKWQAQISIEGKHRHIGYYENEEAAAADFARAVFKYKGQGALDKAREANEQNSCIIDLSDVPPQSPIPKSAGSIREGASKMRRKLQLIMLVQYSNTKVKGHADTREQNKYFISDLSDVPPQPPIPKSAGYIKEGASKYNGVTFNKPKNKWHARIMIEGKQRHIGCYENEEDAAVDYARAVFMYRGQFGTESQGER